MMLVIRKHAAPFALFLALFFFAGVAFVPAVAALQVEVDQCCDRGATPDAPDTDGECVDCNCPTCKNLILQQTEYGAALVATSQTHKRLTASAISSAFIRSIDYPPEFA